MSISHEPIINTVSGAPARDLVDLETELQFRKELESLINRYSMEKGSNTPDFILSEYLVDCLAAYDKAAKAMLDFEHGPARHAMAAATAATQADGESHEDFDEIDQNDGESKSAQESTSKCETMERLMGIMPCSEVEIAKKVKDKYGDHITVQAGKNGWTILYADWSSEYQDVKSTAEENLKTAMKRLQSNGLIETTATQSASPATPAPITHLFEDAEPVPTRHESQDSRVRPQNSSGFLDLDIPDDGTS